MARIRNEEAGRFGAQSGLEGEAFGLSPLARLGPSVESPTRYTTSQKAPGFQDLLGAIDCAIAKDYPARGEYIGEV